MSSLSISPVCSLCSSDCWKYNVKIGKLRCKWATKLCRVYKRVASQNVWLRELVVQNFNVLPKHESLASTPTIISYNARCYTRIESFQITIPSHIKKAVQLKMREKGTCYKFFTNLNHTEGGNQYPQTWYTTWRKCSIYLSMPCI